MHHARRYLIAAFVGMTTLGLGIQACSKEKEEKKPTTSPHSAVAARAAVKVVKLPDLGQSSLQPDLGAQLHAVYQEGLAQARTLRALETDIPDFGNLDDFCSLFTASCSMQAAEGPVLEDGMTCTTTCPTNTTKTSCTAEATKTICNGVEYTISAVNSASTMACSKISDNVYSFGITADIAANVQGGEVVEATTLACHFSFAMGLDLANPPTDESGDMDFSNMCNTMSCTFGSEVLSCESMQEAMKDNACN